MQEFQKDLYEIFGGIWRGARNSRLDIGGDPGHGIFKKDSLLPIVIRAVEVAFKKPRFFRFLKKT